MQHLEHIDTDELIVTPKSPDTRWVTLAEDNSIISEGLTPAEAIEKAKKVTEDYTLMYVPMEGSSCFF